MHNPKIGYCQSLNFIAGTLLLFMSEEESFWLMCVITECLLPHDWYAATMVGTYLDQEVFEAVVRERLPAIDEKLSSFGLQLSLCSIQWFMCLFVNTLRMEPALRVWDIFLNEGDQVLFRVAIGLLKLHEEEILRCTEASTLHMCLKGTCGDDVFHTLHSTITYYLHAVIFVYIFRSSYYSIRSVMNMPCRPC
jgi:hypothetical protein